MRSSFIPIVNIKLLTGRNFPIRDTMNALYLDQLDNLQVDFTYLLEDCYIGYPELLSWKFYSNVEYWDILLMYNGILNWYDDMKVGMTLNIPTLISIQQMITAITPTNVNTFVTL